MVSGQAMGVRPSGAAAEEAREGLLPAGRADLLSGPSRDGKWRFFFVESKRRDDWSRQVAHAVKLLLVLDPCALSAC